MRLKTTQILFALSSLLIWHKAQSEVLHWPQLCDAGEVFIKNKSHTDLSIWLQKFETTQLIETEYELPHNTTTVIELENLQRDERYSLLNFNPNSSLDINYKCGDSSYGVNSIEGGSLTFKKSDLELNKIWLQNLYTDDNSIEIEFQDFSFQKIKTETFTLTRLESKTLVIGDDLKNWSYYKITSSNKLSTFNLTSHGSEGPVLIQPQQSEVDSGASYFLIGPRSGNSDTFVVKITDVDLINKARDLAKNPQKEKMLFARIEKNHQGFNRNWSKIEKNFWSWSTSEVTGFGDLGSTACNGAPQMLEDRVDLWVNDPGQICFWNYRVKKELTPLEVATGTIKNP